MAFEITVRNTFLDLVDEASAPQEQKKRSLSAPRSWKPPSAESVKPRRERWADALEAEDDASTVDSIEDREVSSACLSSCDSDGASSEHNGEKRVLRLDGGLSSSESDGSASDHGGERVTLSLCDTIAAGEAPRRTKLQSKARMFEPVQALPRDMHCVLMAAHAALTSSPSVFDVHMSDGRLGGTTTIVGSYARGALQVFELVKTLSIVKMVLLDAASNSENTYVIGYSGEPFTEIGHSGFSAKIGSVMPLQESTTCWDSYQKGFCPRQATCRWCHPQDSDLANVIVMLNEV